MKYLYLVLYLVIATLATYGLLSVVEYNRVTYCDIQFNNSIATVPCKVVGLNNRAEVRL